MKPLCALLLVAMMVAPPSLLAQVLSSDKPPMPAVPASRPAWERVFSLHPGTLKAAREQHPVAALTGSRTVFLPLPAGFSIVSLPVRTSSQVLSDLFPNLPDGSAVWTWDVANQQFHEGLSGEMPLGAACWMYLPTPALVAVNGEPNSAAYVPVALRPGWNLVGVPYESNDLTLSDQYVYVDQVKTSLPDAVSAGNIGKILTLSANDYNSVSMGDTLQPFRGYWIYSNGNYTLDIQPVRLGDGWADFFSNSFMGWGLKSVGSGIIGGVASYGVSRLLTSLIGDPVAEKLEQISRQLDQLAQGQEQIKQSLSGLANQLAMSTEDIKITVGDAAFVGPVRAKLDAHYDSPTPGASLSWFKAQATPSLAPLVTQAVKTQFASDVLRTWDFPTEFGNIKLAILGNGSAPGVIDNFANKIVLSSNSYTLMDRYAAMQNYFAELIGLQIKCAELISEAYNQLAADPATSANNPAGQAAFWYNNVFKPAIKAEYEYYGQVVERIALSKVTHANNATDPATIVPNEVQLMMAQADFMIMDALEEQPGLRVHLAQNYDLTLPTEAMVSARNQPAYASRINLPAASQWRTVSSSKEYDSWSIRNSKRQLRITNLWKVTKLTMPEFVSGAKVAVLPEHVTEPTDSRIDVATLQTYDGKFQPAASGRAFASVLVVERPSAKSMMNMCVPGVQTVRSDNFSGESSNPSYTGATLNPCNTLSITRTLKPAWVYADVPFSYVGTEAKTSSWRHHAQYWHTGPDSWSNYKLQLFDGTTLMSQRCDSGSDALHMVPSVTWTPGHNYSARLSIQQEYIYNGYYFTLSLKYLDALITVP